jgi:hypothetical protein
MYTKYQIFNVILANEYSKSRKLTKLNSLELSDENLKLYEDEILDGEEKSAVMARAEADDRLHWITAIGKKAAVDLLTLGKVQPEHMLEMSALPLDDFREAVKIATGTARKLNDVTAEAERELNLDMVANELI